MSLSSLLIHTVTIEEQQAVKTGMGGSQLKWVAIGTKSARVQPASAREIMEFEARKWQANYSVQFDADPQMDSNKRIIYGDKVLEFRGVINWQEMNFHWTVACEFKSIQNNA